MAFDEYVALSAFTAGGRDYVRGEPVDDEMDNFFILTDLDPKRAAHRATPEGRAAVEDHESSAEAAQHEAEAPEEPPADVPPSLEDDETIQARAALSETFGEDLAAKLASAGYSSVEEVRAASDAELRAIPGVGKAALASIRTA